MGNETKKPASSQKQEAPVEGGKKEDILEVVVLLHLFYLFSTKFHPCFYPLHSSQGNFTFFKLRSAYNQ